MSGGRKRRALLAVVGAAVVELGCPEKQQPPGNLMAPRPRPVEDAGTPPPAVPEVTPEPRYPPGNLMAPPVPKGAPLRPNTATGLLPEEVVQRVIVDHQKAFEDCVVRALRRDPNLAVGSIEVVLLVGASGTVTSSSIMPAKHHNTEWGRCLREVGNRMTFPKSDGETEVSVPLKIGATP